MSNFVIAMEYTFYESQLHLVRFSFFQGSISVQVYQSVMVVLALRFLNIFVVFLLCDD